MVSLERIAGNQTAQPPVSSNTPQSLSYYETAIPVQCVYSLVAQESHTQEKVPLDPAQLITN